MTHHQKPCRIIALFNQAGGVGKSTLTMNLGYHLSKRGNQVLLIDLDPQSTLTNFMGISPDSLEKTVYDAIVKEEELFIYPEDLFGMHIAPSNINLCGAEMVLPAAMAREHRLSNSLTPLLEKYDFILIDCPPSLGILSVLGLTAATHILVPIQCQFKALLGTDLLLKTVVQVRKNLNKKLEIAGFIPTMLDNRTAQESRMAQAVVDQLSKLGTIYQPIPKTIAFADASEKRKPLSIFAPGHRAVKVLKEISNQLETL